MCNINNVNIQVYRPEACIYYAQGFCALAKFRCRCSMKLGLGICCPYFVAKSE